MRHSAVRSSRRNRPCLFGPFAALAVLCGTASAWWAAAHNIIDEATVLALPEDMPEFFRKGGATISSYSMDPDVWKNRKLPALRAAEHPEHYLDLELLKGKELPRTRAEFHALCRELKVAPDKMGTLPYAIQEWYERLVLAFAEHRRWPKDERVRAKILYVAGVLSHYTGDASQPLHCTVHFDGRAKADGSSPETGIHLKMDALPDNVGITPEEAARSLRVSAVEDTFALSLATIRWSNRQVDKVYLLEAGLPAVDEKPTSPDPRVRSLALECCRVGAVLTATVWYSAWVNSAKVELPGWRKATNP